MIKRSGAMPHMAQAQQQQQPQLRMADGDVGVHPRFADDVQLGNSADISPDVQVMRSSQQMPQPYRGPLAVGDPGVSSSLWRESRSGNDVFRDNRAWQPMDLMTIVVTERSIGVHDADTETRSESQVLAAIQNFLGLEAQTKEWNNPPNLSSIVNATTTNEYRGEGNTRREAQLTARISAVVVEVLPSGLLRIEGEKILAVNNEEQVMVISGLARSRDINSNNEIESSKIGQMRIDYYGKGIVGEAQYGGWLGRLMRYVWPF
jgi:flagellar L-ring protein precursor FlgH